MEGTIRPELAPGILSEGRGCRMYRAAGQRRPSRIDRPRSSCRCLFPTCRLPGGANSRLSQVRRPIRERHGAKAESVRKEAAVPGAFSSSPLMQRERLPVRGKPYRSHGPALLQDSPKVAPRSAQGRHRGAAAQKPTRLLLGGSRNGGPPSHRPLLAKRASGPRADRKPRGSASD